MSLVNAGRAGAAKVSDDLVELNLDQSGDGVFILTPEAGASAPTATTLQWNGDDVCVVVPPGVSRRVIAEHYEGRWSIETPDGHRRVVAVRVDEHTAPMGLSSLTPEEISQLWGVFVDAWSPRVARLLAHIDPTRACITIDSELRPLPPLDRRLRYLAVTANWRGPPGGSMGFSRYRELRYLRLTGYFPRERVEAATIRAPHLEYLSLLGDVRHVAALGRLAELRKLDLRGIDRLGDTTFLSKLRALEELALSGVEDLRSTGALPALRRIEADAAPVRELPVVAMTALQYLDILSSPVATDVVRRFAALNPQCRIRHRFNDLLQNLFRDASLVRISWRLRGKHAVSTAEERRSAEIQALASKLVVAETTARLLCGCLPGVWLDVTTPRGTSRLDFTCGSTLQAAEWPGDANLTPSSVEVLEQWMEKRGVDLANCYGCTAHGSAKHEP